MTPFELSLQNELETETRRFHSQWIFPWYQITDRGFDVESFDGGRIRLGGIAFGHQQQQIFWEAIGRYCAQKVIDIFKNWASETANYPPDIRRKSLKGAQVLTNQFIAGVFNHALRTDRALRGKGNPRSVPMHDVEGRRQKLKDHIEQVASSYLFLFKTEPDERPKKSLRSRIEELYSANQGAIQIVVAVVAVLGFLFLVFG
jgi:hypothetical protein